MKSLLQVSQPDGRLRQTPTRSGRRTAGRSSHDSPPQRRSQAAHRLRCSYCSILRLDEGGYLRVTWQALFRAVIPCQILHFDKALGERVACFDVFWLMPVMIYIRAASNKIQQYVLTFPAPAAPRCQLESNPSRHPRGQEHCLYLKLKVWATAM